jgi:selenocysteine-specific elongation factor
MSPKDLLGGGTLDASAAATTDDEVASEAPELAALARALHETALVPKTAAQLGAAANVREDRASEVLEELVAAGRARKLLKPVGFVDGAAAHAMLERILAIFAQRQAEQAWALGTTSLALARELGVDEPFVVRLLASFVEDGAIAARAGYYATPGFTPTLTAEQRALFERLVPLDPAQPYLPASLDELAAEVRRSKIAGVSQAFDTLVATQALVKVNDAVYRGTQIGEIRGKLETVLRRDKQITMAGFRDIVGTSRKFAVPLLEWFDATGVTLRNGDIRVLRGGGVGRNAGRSV